MNKKVIFITIKQKKKWNNWKRVTTASQHDVVSSIPRCTAKCPEWWLLTFYNLLLSHNVLYNYINEIISELVFLIKSCSFHVCLSGKYIFEWLIDWLTDSVQMRENTDQNNSKYGHFSSSDSKKSNFSLKSLTNLRKLRKHSYNKV